MDDVDFSQYLGPHMRLNLVFPGDVISTEKGFMHGQGTYQEGKTGTGGPEPSENITASVIGKVDKTSKVIMVRPIKCRYTGEIGDIVVGRVAEITVKRWKIDINSLFYATLHLNSINLPSGVQRRKTYEDEQSMREIFREKDMIVAEVHSVNQDGSVNLQTRNLRYGKLEQGFLVKVNPKLIKRQKAHYVDLNCGVTIIMGMNCWIWITRLKKEVKGEDVKVELNTEPEVFEKMAKFRNIIILLNQENCDIVVETVLAMYDLALQQGTSAKGIMDSELNGAMLGFIKDKIEKKIPVEIAKLAKAGALDVL